MTDDCASREDSRQSDDSGKGHWVTVQIVDDDPATSDARKVRQELLRLFVGAMVKEKRCMSDVK